MPATSPIDLPAEINLGKTGWGLLLEHWLWCLGYLGLILLGLACIGEAALPGWFLPVGLSYLLGPAGVFILLYCGFAPLAKLGRIIIGRLEDSIPGVRAWKTPVQPFDKRTLKRLAQDPDLLIVPDKIRYRAYFVIHNGRLSLWGRDGARLVRFASLPPGPYRIVMARPVSLELTVRTIIGDKNTILLLPGRSRMRNTFNDREDGFQEIREWSSTRR